MFTVIWSGHLVFLLTHILWIICLFCEFCVDLLSLVCTCPLFISLLSTPSLFPLSLLYFTDGMCSCCCLLFPIAVFASQHGDFGIAAELRCHGSGLCCRTVYTWDLESFSVVFLPPIYSTSLSGFLWCSRGYQHPSLTLSSLSSQPHQSKLTYVMRHIHLKTKFMSIPAPVPLSLVFSFHLLISLSL